MSWLGDRARDVANRLRKTGKRIRESLPGRSRDASEQRNGRAEPVDQQNDAAGLEIHAADRGLLDRVRSEYFTPDGELRKPRISISGEFGVYYSGTNELKPWTGSIDSDRAASNTTSRNNRTSNPISPENAERLAAASGTEDPEAITQAIDQYLTEDYIIHGFDNVGGYGPGVGMRVLNYDTLDITWSGEPYTPPSSPSSPPPSGPTPDPQLQADQLQAEEIKRSFAQRVRNAFRRLRGPRR